MMFFFLFKSNNTFLNSTHCDEVTFFFYLADTGSMCVEKPKDIFQYASLCVFVHFIQNAKFIFFQIIKNFSYF